MKPAKFIEELQKEINRNALLRYRDLQRLIFKLATKKNQTEADMRKLKKMHLECDKLSDVESVRLVVFGY